MTPAERKATEAVVRAAKRCLNADGFMYEIGTHGLFPLKPTQMRRLENALARLLREEAKTKEKRRGK